MKKETAFVASMFVLGIVAAVWVSSALIAITVPATSPYLLTIAEQTDLERMAAFARSFGNAGVRWTLSGLLLAALTASFALFLQVLNPHVRMTLRNWKSQSGAKLLVVLLVAGAWAYLVISVLDSMLVAEPRIGKIGQLLALLAGTGGLWFVAGETGWAGDFSSRQRTSDAKPIKTILSGAAVGASVFTIMTITNRAFNKYLFLVSEVLDRSGEVSFLGQMLLVVGLLLLFWIVFPLLASFVAALAPVRDVRDLRHRLRAPLAGSLAALMLLGAAYGYAGSKYDLNKGNLARLLNVSDKAEKSETVITLLASKKHPVVLQNWPLQVTGSDLFGLHTISLSRDNLVKVEQYLSAHPAGTVFANACREILVAGYNALWDMDNGMLWQIRAADATFLYRHLLLARLRYLPVTDINRTVLQEFSDEKVWHAGGKAALALSAAYRHFGKTDEAARWLRQAKESGTDVAKTGFMQEPVVTNGAIRGRIALNGKPLAGVKIALIGYSGEKEYRISAMTLSRSLADVKRTDHGGGFTFSSLGSGTYVLAIVLDKSAAGPGRIAASNVPGPVRVGSSRPRNLGTIALTIAR